MLSTDALAHSWPQGQRKYAFPLVSLLAQTPCRIRENEECVLLVAPYWPNSTWFLELMLLVTAPPCWFLWGRICFFRDGAPSGICVRTSGNSTCVPWMRPRWPTPGGSTHCCFSTSTVHKTGLCSEVEPIHRLVFLSPWGPPEMLDQSLAFFFPQQGLERRLTPSTLNIYISAYHDPVEGRLVGKHDLVDRFLREATRLNPPRPPSLPSWDLVFLVKALKTAQFETLQSVELRFFSLKTLLLTKVASIKMVGDLQACSVNESCLEFGLADSSATLSLAKYPRFLPLPSGTR